MVVLNPPCKDCTQRQVGCHSTCQGYREYQEMSKQMSQEKYKKTSVEGDLIYLEKKRRRAGRSLTRYKN